MAQITGGISTSSRQGQPDVLANSRRRIVVIGFLVLASLIQIVQWGIVKPMRSPAIDYPKHWQAAHALIDGGNPYIGELWMAFNYPQATGCMFLWLAWLPLETSETVWKLMNFGLIGLTGFLCWKYFRPRAIAQGPAYEERAMLAGYWWLLTLLICAFYYPLISSIYSGNIDPVNAFLIVGLTAALMRERERLAGILWLMITLIKLMPVILLWPVILWRRWRLLKVFVVGLEVYLILLLLTDRFKYEWFFIKEAIPRISYFWRGISITPMRFFAYAVGWGPYFDTSAGFAKLMHIDLIIFGSLFLCAQELLRRRRVNFLASLEAALIFIPALAPLLEYHHFVWILPVFLLQCRRGLERGFSPWILGCLSVGWALLLVGFNISFHLAKSSMWGYCPSVIGYLVVVAATIIDLLSSSATYTELSTTDNRAIHSRDLATG